MLFNVSTLLTEPVGAARTYQLQNEVVSVPAEEYGALVSGTVSMVRTTRGILVHARLEVAARLQCARCLTAFEQPVALEFDEEFIPLRDPETGAAVEAADEEEFRIDEHQHLDLSEAVRQYEVAALPIRPICRPDCAGLCPICGQDLNQGACDCVYDVTDSRWTGLAGLAELLRTEEDHGSPEA